MNKVSEHCSQTLLHLIFRLHCEAQKTKAARVIPTSAFTLIGWFESLTLASAERCLNMDTVRPFDLFTPATVDY